VGGAYEAEGQGADAAQGAESVRGYTRAPRRGLMLLNEPGLIQLLLSDQHVSDTFGVLECALLVPWSERGGCVWGLRPRMCATCSHPVPCSRPCSLSPGRTRLYALIGL
jgi:hypothetical protein